MANREEVIDKLAGEILADVGIEKQAKERINRIDAFRDFYSKDKYNQNSINNRLDRAEARLNRAQLKDQIANAEGAEKKKLIAKLDQAKQKRNNLIVKSVGDSLNPVDMVKAIGGSFNATAKGAPHNLIVPTYGSMYDTNTAATLAIQDTLKKRQKAAALFDSVLMEKEASEQGEEKIAMEKVAAAVSKAGEVFQNAQLVKQAAQEYFDEADALEQEAIATLSALGYELVENDE